MKRLSGLASIVVILLGALAACSRPAEKASEAAKTGSARAMMKMRVFEGIKEGGTEPVKVVTASYLNYALTASIQSEADASAQQAKLKQIFNLKEVSLLTEADLVWDKGKSEKAFHIFRIDKQDYLAIVTPVDITKLRFRIEVFEQKDSVKTNLLDTEFTAAPKNAAVFGFSAADGKPYFISMQTIQGPAGVEAAAVMGTEEVPPEGAVRAVGNIKPPELIKQVDPAYPEAARQARVEGVVILEATTDVSGRVIKTRILRSIPLLDQAAVEAVQQWVYEPMVIDGKKRGVVFTVTVRFTLDGQGRKGEAAGGVVVGILGGAKSGVGIPNKEGKPFIISMEDAEKLSKMAPIKAAGDIQPPARIRYVDPVYPEAARAAGAEGTVILEVGTDIYGRVESVGVLRSVSGLDQAAIGAVKQWVYQPLIIDGKPRRCLFTVTVRFTLK